MQQLSELQQIIYGALFHDIGKLFYKAGRQKDHVEAGVEAAKQVFEYRSGEKLPKIIEHAVKYHHGKRLSQYGDAVPETWLVYEADNIAAGLDRRGEEELAESESESQNQNRRKFDKELCLRSTFSLLDEDDSKLIDDTDYRQFPWNYRLTMLGRENNDNKVVPVYPSSDPNWKASKDKYAEIAAKWDGEVEVNRKVLAKNPNAMLLLMESLLSFAPSDTCLERIPDISLFEHLRITAAIASCMYINAKDDGETDFKKRGHWDQSDTHRSLEQFILVGGDLSGIQKFIYNITNKGALRSLRARSFYLEILIEHLVDDLLTLAGGEHGSLSRANIIYSGGGHFYLLLPNTSRVELVLEKINTQFNQWLWDQFKGGLSMSLAWVECSSNDLMDPKENGKRYGWMKRKWQELSKKLGEQKTQRFSCLDDNSFLELFEPGKNATSGKECVITQVDHDLVQYALNRENESLECNRLAAALHAFGQKLPKANFLWVRQGVDEDEYKNQIVNGKIDSPLLLLPDFIHRDKHSILQVFEAIGKEKDDLRPEDHKSVKSWLIDDKKPGRLYSLNRWVLSEFLHANLLVGQYYHSDDKTDSDGMPSFGDLARSSTGTQKLGVLRADVDSLGELFTKRLKNEVYTFSRLAMLSKQLTLFFKLYLNQICAGNLSLENHIPQTQFLSNGCKKRSAVIVYSGGDDLFIVGAWNQMIELAVDIRNCFGKFTCEELTLSAGLQVFDPHTPIALMANLTELAEKKAKRLDDKKNALCLFPNPKVLELEKEHKREHRDTYHWEDFICDQSHQSSTTSVAATLKQLIDTNMTPKGENYPNQYLLGEKDSWMTTSLMYRLYQLAGMWAKDGYVALPKLAYTFARIEDDLKQRVKINQNFKGLKNYEEIKAFLYDATWLDKDNDQFSKVNIRDFKTMFTIISYLTREEKV